MRVPQNIPTEVVERIIWIAKNWTQNEGRNFGALFVIASDFPTANWWVQDTNSDALVNRNIMNEEETPRGTITREGILDGGFLFSADGRIVATR